MQSCGSLEFVVWQFGNLVAVMVPLSLSNPKQMSGLKVSVVSAALSHEKVLRRPETKTQPEESLPGRDGICSPISSGDCLRKIDVESIILLIIQ